MNGQQEKNVMKRFYCMKNLVNKLDKLFKI